MLYNLAIYGLSAGVRIAALFSEKVKKMWCGQRACFDKLETSIDADASYIWFHAASLGEFEQGRPLIEEIRRQYPHYKIIQTFFSPSGYEVRKDYKGAGIVCYLPLDTPGNVKRFLDLVRPVCVFFIKYEFWKNYLDALRRRQIPVYSVSSIFRPSQIFFKWYAQGYRRVLHDFTHLFVQNEESVRLLASIGVERATVVGDTRFDRVLDICAAAKELPLVDLFKGNAFSFVAGSSWAPDEDIFIRYMNEHPEVKLVIAPHVVDDAHLAAITQKVKGKVVRYTQATPESVSDAQCLIIDCYGLLSSIYRYADVAYVGGGFGVGIHNVLEAAVYGIPVFFGPNNKRFREAQGLLACGGGIEITSYDDFATGMNRFCSDEAHRRAAGVAAGAYVKDNAGALEKILKYTKLQNE